VYHFYGSQRSMIVIMCSDV